MTAIPTGAFALSTGNTIYLVSASDLGVVVLSNGMAIVVAEAIALSIVDIVNHGDTRVDYLPALGQL